MPQIQDWSTVGLQWKRREVLVTESFCLVIRGDPTQSLSETFNTYKWFRISAWGSFAKHDGGHKAADILIYFLSVAVLMLETGHCLMQAWEFLKWGMSPQSLVNDFFVILRLGCIPFWPAKSTNISCGVVIHPAFLRIRFVTFVLNA
jgi:hypothetical protein